MGGHPVAVFKFLLVFHTFAVISVHCVQVSDVQIVEIDRNADNVKVTVNGIRRGRQDEDDDGEDNGGIGRIVQGGGSFFNSLGIAFLPQLIKTLNQVDGVVSAGLNGTDTPDVPSFLVKQGQNIIKIIAASQANQQQRVQSSGSSHFQQSASVNHERQTYRPKLQQQVVPPRNFKPDPYPTSKPASTPKPESPDSIKIKARPVIQASTTVKYKLPSAIGEKFSNLLHNSIQPKL